MFIDWNMFQNQIKAVLGYIWCPFTIMMIDTLMCDDVGVTSAFSVCFYVVVKQMQERIH